MKEFKKKISITLDTDIINMAKLRAENCDRPFSQYVNLILKDYLSNVNIKNEEHDISNLK